MLLPGDTFAGYRVEREIGRGGMGVVYQATQLSLNRVVALKLMGPSLSDDPGVQARFRSEGVAQAAIEHANVVPVYESGEHDGHLYLAMKFIDGEDLRTIIARGDLQPVDALRILAPVANALDAAHRAHYVHRDVKSRNILVARDGTSYLADFGLTKALQDADRTLTHGVVGTAGYLAPEQLEGKPATPASDIHALAAVICECLTGQLPGAHGRPPLAPEVDAVLARGLAKDPRKRHASAGELLRKVDEAIAGQTIEHELTAHRRWWPAAASAVIAALALVLALVLWPSGDPKPDRPADKAASTATAPSGDDARATATVTQPAGNDDVEGELTVDGPAKEVKITKPGQKATLTFEGRKGDRVSALASNVRFGDRDLGTTWVHIWDPTAGPHSGLQPATNGEVSATDGELGTITLGSTGTYLVEISPVDDATGSLKLALTRDVGGELTVDGPAKTIRLTKPGQNGTLTFEGRKGDRVSTFASNVRFGDRDLGSTWVHIWDPTAGPHSGLQPAINGEVSATEGELGSFTLESTGTYLVAIEPVGTDTGSLELALTRDVGGELTIGGPAKTLRFTRPGQNATLTFKARSGQDVTAVASNVRLTDRASAWMSIWEPGWEFQLQPTVNGEVTSEAGELRTVTLPSRGTHTLAIEPVGPATGTLDVRLK